MLWDVSAFVHNTITVQLDQPFRMDALSVLPWIARLRPDAPPPSGWLSFLAAAPALALALWRCPRSAAGFAAAVGFAYLVFFALNRQAFCNYYDFVIGALCCAVAAMPNAHKMPQISDADRAAAQSPLPAESPIISPL
jgi:hypothetical protein